MTDKVAVAVVVVRAVCLAVSVKKRRPLMSMTTWTSRTRRQRVTQAAVRVPSTERVWHVDAVVVLAVHVVRASSWLYSAVSVSVSHSASAVTWA